MVNAIANDPAGTGLKQAAVRDAFNARIGVALANVAKPLAEQARYLTGISDMAQALAATGPVEQHVDGTVMTISATVGDNRTLAGAHSITRDRWGNILSVADARDPNWKISYTYNHDNQQLTKTANALAGATGVPASTTGYDALGRVARTADMVANGKGYASNINSYDANGNVKSETHADGGVVGYTYDLFGNRLSMTQQRGAGLPDLVTLYTYDHLNHLRTVSTGAKVVSYTAVASATQSATLVAVKDAAAQLTQTNTYDELGRNVTRTDAAGAVSRITYDLDGNVIMTANGSTGPQTVTSYDVFHNRVAMRDALGNGMRWTVDRFGRVSDSTSIALAVADVAAASETVTV